MCIFACVGKFYQQSDKSLKILVFNWDRVSVQFLRSFPSAFIHTKLTSLRLFFKWKLFVEKMVEGETSRIWERSTETISIDTSCGRQDLSNRYSTPVIGGQKIDVENFDGKINFACGGAKLWMLLFKSILILVWKNKRHLYDEEIWDRIN